MKTIEVSRRSKALNELLRKARKENVIIRSADGDEFILAEVDDFDLEVKLVRNNKALMRFLENRAKEPATVTLGEARKALGVRNE